MINYQTQSVQYNSQNNPGNILLNQRTIRRTITQPNQPPITQVQRYINEIPINGSNIFNNLPSQLNLPNMTNARENSMYLRRTFTNNLTQNDFDNTNFENNLDNIFRNFLNNPIGILFTNLDSLTNFDDLNNLENVTVYISDINTVSQIINFNDIIDKEQQCAICLESFNDLYINNNSIIFRETICNHIYCNDCLSTWLSMSKKCPLCSKNLEDLSNNIDQDNLSNYDSNNNLSDIDSNLENDFESNLESDLENNFESDLENDFESDLENNEESDTDESIIT
jgi:hypothetical protein